jgi:type IV pilus assembly protein PilF
MIRRLALLIAAAATLAGCANPPGGAPVGRGTDIVTASDETEARRRARLRLELAVNYFEQGQTTVALDELKQALTADPNLPEAYNLRGLVYMRLNDLALAEESFRRAQQLNPRDPDIQHNHGWLLCQQGRYAEAGALFAQAAANPVYPGRAKSYMAHGLCEMRANRRSEAEALLLRAYEIDAGNPITGYNLAQLLMQRGDLPRAQFYIRRLNNSEFANAQSLWLGIQVERRLNDRVAQRQLGEQLQRRFPDAPETQRLQRGAFDD